MPSGLELANVGRPNQGYVVYSDEEDLIESPVEDEERTRANLGVRADDLQAASASEFFSSLFILCFMVLIYLWGAVELCRKHIWMEALFTVALPVFAIRLGWQGHTSAFQQRMIYRDTLFNVFAVVAKIAIVSDTAWLNHVVNYATIVFLLLQFGWIVVFAVNEGRKEERTFKTTLDGMHWFTAVMAATMFVSLVVERAEAGHFFFGAANTLGPEGELLFWGQDAGVMIKLNYVCYSMYVLFCDDFKHKVNEPGLEGYMMVPVAQFCSVILSWWSGEFWHARMITDVHLVLMDGIFHTHNIDMRHQPEGTAHGEFCVMPEHWYKETEHRKKPCCTNTLVPLLKWALLPLALLSAAAGVACGSQEFFCGMHVTIHHALT